jgi:sporulation protein YhbH
MSTFRERRSVADRSAADRKRHKEKIDRAIRDGIKDVIADESIIGQEGSKKVKIPVKGIKEYQFIYGENKENKKVASAGDKDVKRGQVLRKKPQKGKGKSPGRKGSNETGEEYYEVEVSLDELAEYLFANLELPDLEKKRFRFVRDKKLKRSGYRKKGMRSRLSKKETIKRKIRRKKMAVAAGSYDPESGERFPFHKDDLKYKHMREKVTESSSAVIFFIMDVSGSMDTNKKYLARSFYFLLYQFLRYRYENVEVVFLSHCTEAKEVSEDDFFKRGTSGGTIMSSALEMEKEIIAKRYHPSNWNVYTFYCGDGENWPVDNAKATELINELAEVNQLISYAEINPFHSDPNPALFNYRPENDGGSMWHSLSKSDPQKVKRIRIIDQSDIFPAFSKLFGGGNKS